MSVFPATARDVEGFGLTTAQIIYHLPDVITHPLFDDADGLGSDRV